MSETLKPLSAEEMRSFMSEYNARVKAAYQTRKIHAEIAWPYEMVFEICGVWLPLFIVVAMGGCLMFFPATLALVLQYVGGATSPEIYVLTVVLFACAWMFVIMLYRVHKGRKIAKLFREAFPAEYALLRAQR